MKKFTKIMSLVLAMVLCVGIGVGATLAWLTDKTTEVKNTFSAQTLIDPDPDPHDDDKKAGFDIWEHHAETKADGTNVLVKADSKKEADLVKANDYPRVLPDIDIHKDPFVRVKTKENAYIYLEVLPTTLPETMVWSVDAAEWTEMPGVTGPNGGKIYKYKAVVAPADGALDINVLTGKLIEVKPEFEPSTLTAKTPLSFYAFAAQATGFESPEDAWTATFGAAKA